VSADTGSTAASASPPVAPTSSTRGDNLLRRKLFRALRNPIALTAAIILVTMTTLAVLAPWIAPYDPLRINTRNTLAAPSAQHWFGTDDLGRDVLSRVLWGGRVSLRVGFIAATISLLGGLVLGLLSGYFGGRLAFLILRAMDLLLAFPGLLLALVIVGTLGAGLENIMIAVGIGAVPIFTRIVYGAVLSVKGNDYVDAARALGATDARIIVRHVIPNVLAPVIVLFTLQMGAAIFSASSLSFIGLGAQPPSPEWGAMVARGRHVLREAMWMTTFPGIAIALVILSINVVGDTLRDVLDPRQSTG
jgi:peptide/nickel transport system permease protein